MKEIKELKKVMKEMAKIESKSLKEVEKITKVIRKERRKKVEFIPNKREEYKLGKDKFTSDCFKNNIKIPRRIKNGGKTLSA